MPKKKKVAVGLSGGVDSSVTAALLKKQGYDVVGIFMQNWTEPGCRTPQDRADAVKVASFLNIPFDVWDFEGAYREKVIGYFYEEYAKGRTPNPDVMCNKEIKFKLFFDRVMNELKVDYVATGHYAISREGKLYAGADPKKDQSYFLYALKQEHLEKTLFPLGELTKVATRKLALEFELPVATKPDSQGICFVGEINVRDFLRKRIQPNPGPIVSVDGNALGEHDGLAFYTLGQRHGLSIGSGIPYYVAAKDGDTNTLYVSKLNDERFLYTKEVEVEDLHIINPKQWKQTETDPRVRNDDRGSLPKTVWVRIRHLQQLQKAQLVQTDSQYKLVFEDAQRAATPGQSAVMYLEDGQVLGGAIISENQKLHALLSRAQNQSV